jgi:uncharacterized membrane protein HdeD (DUF308 family)
MRKARARLAEFTKIFLIVQGSLAILFGIVAMSWPGITAVVLAFLFAIFLLFDGLVLTMVSLTGQGKNAGIRLAWGLLQVLMGLFVLFHPQLSFAVLIIVLGISILMRGVFSLAHAVTHNDASADERLLHGLLGGLGIVVGGIVAVQPAAGGLAFVWVLGFYAVVTGALLIGLAFGVARITRRKGRTTLKF